MNKYQEKLFRIKYGYMEITDDEFPELPAHYADIYKGIKHISNLSEAEKIAFHTRSLYRNKFPNMDKELVNKHIDSTVFTALQHTPGFDTNLKKEQNEDCDHDWQICKYHQEGHLWWKFVYVEEYCTKCGLHRLRVI